MAQAKLEADEIRGEIRRQNRIASAWLINYRERKRGFEERLQEIKAGVKPVDENVGGGRSGPGNPTGSMVVKTIDFETGETAKWLQVVEDVARMVGSKKLMLLKLRQECKYYISPDGGRPGWIAPVQQRFGEMTGWCPAEQTLKDMWGSLVTLAIQIAGIHGCKF